MSKDVTEKRLEEHADVFADIFNHLLFHGQEVLKEEELISLPTESYVRKDDGKLHENRRDVRMADKDRNVYRLICGIENQTQADNTMPERIMGYDYAAYEGQIKEYVEANRRKGTPAFAKRIHEEQKLVPVVTAVLHWGYEEWDGPVRLHEMLKFPEENEELIRPLVPDYPINLIEVSRIPEEVCQNLTSDFGLIAEYLTRRKDPKRLEEFMKDRVHTIRHPEEFLDVLSEVANDKQYKKVREMLQEEEKGDMTMCVIADKLVNQGREEGREEGKLMIKKLMAEGLLKMEDVLRVLGKTAEEFEREFVEVK